MPDDTPSPFDFGYPASPGDRWPAIMGAPGEESEPSPSFSTKAHEEAWHVPHEIFVRRGSVQSIPNATNTFIDFDEEVTDTVNGYPSTIGTPGTSFIFGADTYEHGDPGGIWLVTGTLSFAANATGFRRVRFSNPFGGVYSSVSHPAVATAAQTTDFAIVVYQTMHASGAGSLGMGMEVFQNSGAALNVAALARIEAVMLYPKEFRNL